MFSFKFKLLAALTALTSISLTLFLAIAQHVLQADRMDQAFEATSVMASQERSQVDSALQGLLTNITVLLRNYDSKHNELKPAANDLFENSPLLKIGVWSLGHEGWKLGPELRKAQSEATDPSLLKPLIEGMKDDRMRIVTLEGQAPKDRITGILGVSPTLRLSFEVPYVWLQPPNVDTSRTNSFLFIPSQQKILSASALPQISVEDQESILAQLTGDGAAYDRVNRLHLNDGRVVFAAKAGSGQFDLGMISVVTEEDLLKPWKLLSIRFIYLFGAVVSLSILIGLLLSKQMSSSLEELNQATESLSSGDFNLKLSHHGQDEFGRLRRAFLHMSKEILRLMGEMVNKGRMEGELKTAQTVQETLFPAPFHQNTDLRLAGRYRSASECGGDWWNTWENGDHTYVMIVDITGHGAPAALLTSAACAAMSILRQQDMPLTQIVDQLNRAIHSTAKGSRMMTGFFLKINRITGEVDFVNASHELIIRLPAVMGEDTNWRSLDFIGQPVENPRLGERPDVIWKGGSFKLEAGERLFLMTDGLTDVQNREGKAWGERKAMSNVLKAIQEETRTTRPEKEVLDSLFKMIDDYRAGQDAPDDITMILLSWKRPLANPEDLIDGDLDENEAWGGLGL